MLDEFSSEAAVASLSEAAEDGALSTSVRDHARGLADRLKRGVRIVAIGPKNVGKSSVCNAILSAFPANGDPESRIFGGALTGEEPDILTAAGPVLPLDRSVIGHAQIIDLTTPRDPQAFESHVKECLELADIVLWCTQEFSVEEASLWQQAPDHLKDHSFLILTKADILADAGALHARVAALQPVVSEEFHSFFPVTTARLENMLRLGQDAPASVRAASGIAALTDALTSLVQSGQRADLDGAMLFLERHGVPLKAPEPETLTAPDTPHDAVQPELEPVQQAFPGCLEVRKKMMARAFDLAELGFDETEGDMSGVLDLCVSISEDLARDMREQADEVGDLAVWSDAFEAAADKIMLMTMENDTRSAADAVTILLQMRRDLDQLAFQ